MPNPASPADPYAAPDGAGRQQHTTTLGVVFLVLFLDLVGFSIVFPLFGEMLVHYERHDTGLLRWCMERVDAFYPGASTVQRAALFGGVLGAVYSTLQFVCAPLWGRMSDRIGRRPVLLLSMTGTTIAYALWFFAGSFSLLLLSRLIAGVMTGNVAVANAAVADITTPQTRARGMGFIGMAFGLGFILGPAIGGLSWWFSHHHLPMFEDPDNRWLNPFSLPAAIACGLCLLNLIWAAARFRETLPPERRAEPVPAGRTANPAALFDARLGAGVARINLAFMLHTMLFAGMEATLVFFAAERCAFTPARISGLFVWMGFLSALTQGGIFRRLSGRVGQRPLTMAGFLTLIPGFALIAAVDWFPHTWLLWVAVTVLASGTGLVFPGLNTMASLAGDPQRQGWVMGTFRSAGALGRALGPLLGALAYYRVARSAPYIVGAAGMILPLLLVARARVGARPVTG
jgi:MFS family permease